MKATTICNKVSLITVTAGNSWDILNVILGHNYHINQSKSFVSNERSHNLQQKWVWLYRLLRVSWQYMNDRFVDISTEDARTVLLGN